MTRKLLLLLQLLATVAAMSCFAANITTRDGTTYRNAQVTGVDSDGIRVTHSTGVAKLRFEDLPEALQKQYHYDAAKVTAYRKQVEDAQKPAAAQAAAQQNEARAIASPQATATAHGAANKVYEVVLKDVPGTGLFLELDFYRNPPPPKIVDRMLRNSVEQAVSIDGTRDILAMAFLGEDVLTDTQYSGELVYRASQRKIMTGDESRGVKTTVTDTGGRYSLEVSEDKTVGGIKPERKWLTLSLIYSTEPPLQEAYDAMLFEIEKMTHSGVDINAYVKIGDKNIKTSQKQMNDPSGGFVFTNFDARSGKVYRKNILLKTIK